jgi:hypothetical protein
VDFYDRLTPPRPWGCVLRRHVGLYRILGTGLSISGQASDSGPYSNITFDLSGISGYELDGLRQYQWPHRHEGNPRLELHFRK